MTTSVRVLLVEDDLIVQLLVEEMLQEAGFQVVAAANGGEALELLATAAPRLRVAVIDTQPGPGPDGWEVAQRVREAVPEVSVLYMHDGPLGDGESRAVPGSMILTKPFWQSDLLASLGSILAEDALPRGQLIRLFDT